MNLFSNPQSETEILIYKQAMEACETVISEMGAELHDDLIQRLTVLRFSLDNLERALTGHPETDALIVSIKSEFQDVIQSVRKTSRKLLPVIIEDNSFEQNIAILCQNLETPGIGTIHFESTGPEHPIAPLAQTYLYRIIQELIHNAFKHSSAWNVWVMMTWNAHNLLIEVEDDGSGFSRINELIKLLSRKYNTLKMRSMVIRASINYSRGQKGLKATVSFSYYQS